MRGCSYLKSTILTFIEWEISWFVSVLELSLCLVHPFGDLGSYLLPGKAAKGMGLQCFPARRVVSKGVASIWRAVAHLEVYSVP